MIATVDVGQKAHNVNLFKTPNSINYKVTFWTYEVSKMKTLQICYTRIKANPSVNVKCP